MTKDEAQQKFIKGPLEDSKLIGIPGGGKTRSIIKKIKRCLRKEIFTSKYDYIILTFSKMARYDFIEKGGDQNIFNQENVRTLHSLSGTIMTKILGKTSGAIESLIVATLELLKNEDVTLEDVRCLRNVKAIFVDEAQDISLLQYNFLLQLKKKTGAHLIMIGDPNQNIYQFQGGSDKYMMDHPGTVYKLVNNYRSIPNIVQFVNCISPFKSDMVSQNVESDNKPVTIFTGSARDIEKEILKEIKNTTFPLEEIAVISPVKLCKENMFGYTNIGLSIVTNLFSKHEIPFVKHYHDTGERVEKKFSRVPGSVNLLTIHGSKGLEFEKVILLNFHYKTYGIEPSREDYNRFKYMWYVGTSRAKSEMTIMIDKEKGVFPLLRDVVDDVYEINGDIKYPQITFREDLVKLCHSVTEIIDDLTPEQIYRFEKMIDHETTETIIYELDDTIIDYDKYSALYGKFMEEILNYMYLTYHKKENEKNIFQRFLQKYENTIVIPRGKEKKMRAFLKRFSLSSDSQINLEFFEKYKLNMTEEEEKLYRYLKKCVRSEPFSVEFDEGSLYVNRKEELKQMCETFVHDETFPHKIFRLVLFGYQIEYEMGYLWEYDFSEHLVSLQPYIDEAFKFIKDEENLTWWKKTTHPNFPLNGEIDIINGDTIIDVKFTKTVSIKHIIQVLLYYNNLHPDWKKEKKLEIWNLQQGKKYKIDLNGDFTNYDIMKIICDVTNKKMERNLFVYDLETTGLDTRCCKIIDRYFEEYNLGFVASEGLIKIDERIPSDVVELTGITNKMIREEGVSERVFRKEIEEIFKYCKDPQFMAHRGNGFDHLVMYNYKLFPKKEYLDSNSIINLHTREKVSKLKLSDTYKVIMGKENEYGAHRAKPDVKMVIDILRKIGYQK